MHPTKTCPHRAEEQASWPFPLIGMIERIAADPVEPPSRGTSGRACRGAIPGSGRQRGAEP